MPYPIRTLVTGLAQLQEPDACLAPTVELARRLGAELHVVHAYQLPEFFATFPTYEVFQQDVPSRYAEQLQESLEARLRESAAGVRVHAHVVPGAAGRALTSVADRVEADLVVVGRSRHGPLARAFLGTTAQRVLRESTRPVLLVGGPLPTDAARVLVATDLSRESEAVHEAGLDVAEALLDGGGLVVAAVMVIAFGVVPPPLPDDVLQRAGEAELNGFLARRRPRGYRVQPRVRLGAAPDGILAEAAAWHADLVVLGTHGRSRVERYFLGSVAEATLRAAGCNVLVVPPAALRRGLNGSSVDAAVAAET